MPQLRMSPFLAPFPNGIRFPFVTLIPITGSRRGFPLNIDLSSQMRSLREQYHYAWLVVGMGTMLRVTANFVSQAFAVILVVLQTDFAWGVTAIVLAQVFRSVASALLSPVSGWVGDRYGARPSLFVAASHYVAGMLLLSTVDHLWQLYIYYSVLLGLAQALFSVNIPTTVAAWFQKKLGVAVGIQQSIGGMGASVTAPALALLISLTGWQYGFWIIAAVGGSILFALLFFFHSEPADRGMRPLGADDDEPAPARVDAATAKLRSKVFLQHARRTRAFWNLPFIHFLGCMGHAIVIWHVVFFATEQGLSLAAAAWIVTIYTMASVSSRLFIPILADRWGAKATMILPYFLQGVTVIMLFWAQSAWEFYLFAVLFGIGFGGEMSAFLIANRQYYGMGPGALHLRLPAPRLRLRNGRRRIGRRSHLRPGSCCADSSEIAWTSSAFHFAHSLGLVGLHYYWRRLLRPGLDNLHRRQLDGSGLHPAAGVILPSPHPQLGRLPT